MVLKRAGGRHHPGQVLRRAQIASDGAIVVRPDRVIAWRSPAVLTAVLSQTLGADRLLSQGRQVPDRLECWPALMTVCREGAPSANVR